MSPAGATSANTVIAYEPIWAFGTGAVPAVLDVEEMHAAIRRSLADLVGVDGAASMRILYGGSVKSTNARELLRIDTVDGALVDDASLLASDFIDIANAY